MKKSMPLIGPAHPSSVRRLRCLVTDGFKSGCRTCVWAVLSGAHVPETRAEAGARAWRIGRPPHVQLVWRYPGRCATAAIPCAERSRSRELRWMAKRRAEQALSAACRRGDMPNHGLAGGLRQVAELRPGHRVGNRCPVLNELPHSALLHDAVLQASTARPATRPKLSGTASDR